MTRTFSILSLALIGLAAVAIDARAAINVQFQPRHLYDGHTAVSALTVASIDSDTQTVTFDVEATAKGEFAPQSVTMTAAEGEDQLEAILAMVEGQRVVAFIGQKAGHVTTKEVLYYVGGGTFYKAQQTDEPGQWVLVGNADEGKDRGSLEIMFAVFNGSIDQLWEMIQDMAAGRDYFPASPFTRFEAQPIATLDAPVQGVGLVNLDGDEDLELIATSTAGVRVYTKSDDGYINQTAAFGLEDVQAISVSASDVDGDGDTDLLLDATLYLNDSGTFAADGKVVFEGEVLSSAFVELNGDGHPDLVGSIKGGGLETFVSYIESPGKTGLAQAEGLLNLPEEVRNATGYFEPGDFDGDGRTDLLYLAGPGYILYNREEGFEAVSLNDEFEEPEFGTAAIAPILTPGQSSALIVADGNKMLLHDSEEGIEDVTRYGNEIQEDVPGGRMVLAEDLNADGTVDLYLASGEEGSPALFALNRNYGSFMQEEKYNSGKVFPPAVYSSAANGLAAGDVNGDGAIDLLVGGVDGSLTLLINRTLDDRPATSEPSTKLETRKQIETRLVTVIPGRPLGLTGARISLTDAKGRVIDSRQLGSNVGVGSASPLRATLATREPGPHTLTLRYADGKESTTSVDLGPDRPRYQTVPLN